MIPGRKARAYLRDRDPGVMYAASGLTGGSLRWLIAYQLLGAVALVLLVATLAVPRTAHSRDEARALGFGYPLSFVHADLGSYTPPSYPQEYRYDPWENVAHVQGVPFVLDWALFTFALWIPLWLLRRRMT